jgi:hypothetical protein
MGRIVLSIETGSSLSLVEAAAVVVAAVVASAA